MCILLSSSNIRRHINLTRYHLNWTRHESGILLSADEFRCTIQTDRPELISWRIPETWYQTSNICVHLWIQRWWFDNLTLGLLSAVAFITSIMWLRCGKEVRSLHRVFSYFLQTYTHRLWFFFLLASKFTLLALRRQYLQSEILPSMECTTRSFNWNPIEDVSFIFTYCLSLTPSRAKSLSSPWVGEDTTNHHRPSYSWHESMMSSVCYRQRYWFRIDKPPIYQYLLLNFTAVQNQISVLFCFI